MRLLLLLFILSGCIPTNLRKRKFTTSPEQTGIIRDGKIRMDGVYYGFFKHPITGDKRLGYFFFYKNGVMRNRVFLGGIKDTTEDRKWIYSLIQKNVVLDDSLWGDRKDGGAFSIDSNFIKLQDYIYSPGSLTWDLRTFMGQIINDTTIYISNCKTISRPDYCVDGFFLKFIQMQKPDSTNRLMKRKWYWKTK